MLTYKTQQGFKPVNSQIQAGALTAEVQRLVVK